MVIAKKFSASRFWDDVRKYDITSFNALGAIIPILMKQEPQNDQNHKVRMVLSSACPANVWVAFEKRFGVTIYEAYGAVDAPGYSIANLGNAPVGSFGKPAPGTKAKVIDENGQEVEKGCHGELIFKLKKKDLVKFHNNTDATSSKNRDGYLYTGDTVYQDQKGFYYFVGRKTESMRVGGENVSAYEVEQVINKHPKILECAAYPVPSDLAEDDIMVSVRLKKGEKLTADSLFEWTSDKLAKYARPRYIRFLEEIPKTSTHRVRKKELEQTGVTHDTFDSKSNNSKPQYHEKSNIEVA
ncbi:MAG: AMP-binding protein, partial [Flavobacteriales bacterium]|nr:AMP-binding protein [Flavobacteriales bacterium]